MSANSFLFCFANFFSRKATLQLGYISAIVLVPVPNLQVNFREWDGKTIIGGIQINWDDGTQNTLGEQFTAI
jgi:hypothetical protein